MSALDAILDIESGDGRRRLALASYLDAEAGEAAEREGNRWIKSLRRARVDGLEFRDRFTYRGDSLWWFAELYLHKQGVMVSVLKTLSALEALIERERPMALTIVKGAALVRDLASQVAAQRKIACRGSGLLSWEAARQRLSIVARGALYAASALVPRRRPRARSGGAAGPVDVVAFVHTAFSRDGEDGEEYLGPLLRELSGQLNSGGLRVVGVGPPTSFRRRDWRQRLTDARDRLLQRGPLDEITHYASWAAIRPSFASWRQRGATLRALLASDDLRRAAVVRGCDTWRLLRAEWAGLSHLQFPWSARAMDEAAAVLDALRPRAVVTYAEAGGWGRAIVLEARRRGIPVAGQQHGFIYRHWLNYLHEADEMQPSCGNPADRGFPRPTITLVYDGFAAGHLVNAGCFPHDELIATGSPRLDALVDTARRLTDSDREAASRAAGARPGQHLVVLATKFRQVEPVLGDLVRVVASMPEVQLAIKCHPADSPVSYEREAARIANISILPARTDLAALIAAARLIVTVNSTAAIEAMWLDVPALVLALPNNLSPFVQAGAMAGASTPAEIGPALHRLLYDEDERTRLARGRHAFMARHGIGADGQAARRAADAVVALAKMTPTSSGGMSGHTVDA